MKGSEHISAFVKYHREQLGFTQEQLALKAGVGLRFLRELEQGKKTLRLDKVNKVLELFGYEMRAKQASVDAYEIWKNYFNQAVVIKLKNKKVVYGIIINEIKNEQHEITAWAVVPNNNAIEYQKTKNPELTIKINHSDIADIEFQER